MAAQAAFVAALSIVQILDNEEDTESTSPSPGWLLIECDADGKPTARVFNGLHESVLWTDPRNIKAEDIRGW